MSGADLLPSAAQRLRGKTVIVTGASSGMGLAAVKLFEAHGANVVATDIAEDRLADEMRQFSEGVHAITHDVRDEAGWSRVVDETLQRFGAVDALVNNAGVGTGKNLLEHTLESWRFVLDVNLTGVWLGMKAVIPHMKGAGGSIVNTSSIGGLVGGADAGDPGYGAAKGGVRSLTKTAAIRFAPDRIRVNSVHPGPIYNPVMGARRGVPTFEDFVGKVKDLAVLPPHVGEPIDIAYAYLYLASDESRFVTGAEFVIDGGWTAG